MGLLLVFLAGCGSQNETNGGEDESLNSQSSQTPVNPSNAESYNFENAVIVYYSLTENTEEVANEIQSQTGLDLYKIEPVEPYPTAYSEVAGLVRDQQADGIFPDLEELNLDLSQYETIFVGSPTWHGYISQPVQKWLMDSDLAGKNIAPFFTSGSQPIEDPQSDLRALIPDSTIAPELSMDHSPRDDIDESVSAWLSSLTF